MTDRMSNSQAWVDGIRAVSAEAAGLLNVTIVDSETCGEILADAMMGDERAVALFNASLEARRRVANVPRRRPALCVACPRAVKRVTRATIFGVALPATARPEAVIGFVFCARCAADRGTLLAKAEIGLRGVWPDLRPLVVTHPEGGRA
jgi:hypothetical protein